MFSVANNGIIKVTRGDSFTTTLFVNIGTTLEPIRYELIGNDKVYFAVTEPHQDFEHAIVKKVYTVDDLDEDKDVIIKFTPEDTEFLLPGVYYYQVKLRRIPLTDESGTSAELVDTIIAKTKFIILD